MSYSNDKLVINPRDELIQEIAALRDQKLTRDKEAKLQREIKHYNWCNAQKKIVYEWSFARLVKKYFKLEIEDLANLSQDKLERLENLVYEMAKIKFRRFKILLSLIPIAGWTFLLLMRCDSSFLTTKDVPLAKLCQLHDWYKENFGSIAKALLDVVPSSNALKFKEF